MNIDYEIEKKYHPENFDEEKDQDTCLPISYKKMVDRLYRNTRECSTFQRELRVHMLSTWIISKFIN